MAQSIAVNSVVVLLGRAVSLALGLGITAIVSRALGVSDFGVYAALLAFGSLLLVAADVGLYLTLTQQLGRETHPSFALAILSQTFWLRLLALMVVFGLGSVFSRFIPALSAYPVAWWVVALGLSFQSFSQLLLGVFQARSNMWRATAGDIVGRLVQLLGIVVLPLTVASLTPITIMTFAFTLGTVATFLVHRRLLPFPWRLHAPNWKHWRSLVSTAWPIAAMLLLNAIYFRVDMLLLAILRPGPEVGLYGLAYRIIESGLFIPAAFGGLLLPHLSRRRADNNVSPHLLNEALQVTALVGALTVSLLIVLARPLVVFFSGESFSPAAPLLAILSLALLAMFFGNLFGYTLVAFERQRSLMWLYLALAIFNLSVNLALIPKFGAIAAAWTTLITEVAAATVAALLVRQLIPYTLSPSFFLRLAATTATGVTVTILLPDSLPVIVRACVAALVFAGAAAWLRLIGPTQFRTLLTKP